MADDEPMEEAPADAPAEGEVEVAEMSVLDALRDVLKRALIHGGLKRGLREVAKALDSRTAKLCCLAKDCDNAEYSNLTAARALTSRIVERAPPNLLVLGRLRLEVRQQHGQRARVLAELRDAGRRAAHDGRGLALLVNFT